MNEKDLGLSSKKKPIKRVRFGFESERESSPKNDIKQLLAHTFYNVGDKVDSLFPANSFSSWCFGKSLELDIYEECWKGRIND